MSFIHGKIIKKGLYKGLMHVTDWLPTIAAMADVQILGTKFPLDGMNIWDSMMLNKTSPRKNILLNIEMMKSRGPRFGYIEGDYKLIVGTPAAGTPDDIYPSPNCIKLHIFRCTISRSYCTT